ncbi:Crp/Fnr family transcriptional regulator [Roseomonas sp. KE0001]|uniref:Crp/Fnr family transcriptional regulator n=1 Tax=unclassified Roseomonas TaxID=2617492 RepID=UPI00351C88D5
MPGAAGPPGLPPGPTGGPSGPAALAALRRIPFLEGAPEEALARMVPSTRWHQLQAGAVVVDSGDASDDVYFVLEGSVRVVVRTAFGHEAILNDLGPGDFFGELAAIDGVRRSANVTALLRTRLCAVRGAALMELVLQCPAVGRRLLRLLTARLRDKDERLLEATALPVRQRLSAELLRLSRPRGGGEKVLSPPPPQHVLAARIGLRRETVSRELARMSRAGLLTVGRQAIVLHHPEALRREIEALLRGAEAPDPRREKP